MRIIPRIVLFSLVCISVLTIAIAKNFGQPIVTVPGVYESFTVGKGSGDLEGMRVVIFSGGGGYYAIVQIAQGGAEDPKPVFVPADIKGRSVSFSVGDDKYTGMVTAGDLTLKEGSGELHLKRKACSSYFR